MLWGIGRELLCGLFPRCVFVHVRGRELLGGYDPVPRAPQTARWRGWVSGRCAPPPHRIPRNPSGAGPLRSIIAPRATAYGPQIVPRALTSLLGHG